jgi:hypothetical protein
MARFALYVLYVYLFVAALIFGLVFDEGVRNLKILPDSKHIDRCSLATPLPYAPTLL